MHHEDTLVAIYFCNSQMWAEVQANPRPSRILGAANISYGLGELGVNSIGQW